MKSSSKTANESTSEILTISLRAYDNMVSFNRLSSLKPGDSLQVVAVSQPPPDWGGRKFLLFTVKLLPKQNSPSSN